MRTNRGHNLDNNFFGVETHASKDCVHEGLCGDTANTILTLVELVGFHVNALSTLDNVRNLVSSPNVLDVIENLITKNQDVLREVFSKLKTCEADVRQLGLEISKHNTSAMDSIRHLILAELSDMSTEKRLEFMRACL